MAAPRRITDRQVIDAMKKWEGNVAAAAEDLSLARKNLYERVYALGLKPIEFRSIRNATEHKAMSADTKPSGRGVTYVDGSSSDTVTKTGRTSTLVRMPSAELADPIRRAKAGPIRLRPDQVEQLREAKFDFMAKHRIEAAEADLLQRFFDELFPDWLKRTLSPSREKKA